MKAIKNASLRQIEDELIPKLLVFEGSSMSADFALISSGIEAYRIFSYGTEIARVEFKYKSGSTTGSGLPLVGILDNGTRLMAAEGRIKAVVYNEERYSQTTTRHQNMAKRALKGMEETLRYERNFIG